MKYQLISTGIAFATMLTLPTTGATVAQETIRDVRAANSTTVSGEIVRILGDDFILDDGTGQIWVEAESRTLRRAKLAVGETVTVSGHLDEGDLEAYLITRANGEEIYIFDD